jgi:hypothetical protein
MQKDFVAKNAAAMYGGRLRKDPTALQKISAHMAGGSGGFGPMMAQGMALMKEASELHNYNLDMSAIGQIWKPTVTVNGQK